MLPLILIGARENIDKYIDIYKKKENFLSYNIIEYVEKIKISDVRYLQKKIAMDHTSLKLIVFRSDTTLVAQHALLKTLEELPDRVHFILTAPKEDDLLPTIVSRSRLVLLGQPVEIDDNINFTQQVIIRFLNHEFGYTNPIMLVQKLTSLQLPKDTLLHSILLASSQILKNELALLNDTDFEKVRRIILLEEKILFFHPLIITNNVSLEMSLENIFMHLMPFRP